MCRWATGPSLYQHVYSCVHFSTLGTKCCLCSRAPKSAWDVWRSSQIVFQCLLQLEWRYDMYCPLWRWLIIKRLDIDKVHIQQLQFDFRRGASHHGTYKYVCSLRFSVCSSAFRYAFSWSDSGKDRRCDGHIVQPTLVRRCSLRNNVAFYVF